MTRYRIERSSRIRPEWRALSDYAFTAEGARNQIAELMQGSSVKRQGTAFRAVPVEVSE